MKFKYILLVLAVVLLVAAPVAFAMDFTPKGNVNLQNRYNITNAVSISGSVNASDITNPIWVESAGDSMTGDLNMSANDIFSVSDLFFQNALNIAAFNLAGMFPMLQVDSPSLGVGTDVSGFYGTIDDEPVWTMLGIDTGSKSVNLGTVFDATEPSESSSATLNIYNLSGMPSEMFSAGIALNNNLSDTSDVGFFVVDSSVVDGGRLFTSLLEKGQIASLNTAKDDYLDRISWGYGNTTEVKIENANLNLTTNDITDVKELTATNLFADLFTFGGGVADTLKLYGDGGISRALKVYDDSEFEDANLILSGESNLSVAGDLDVTGISHVNVFYGAADDYKLELTSTGFATGNPGISDLKVGDDRISLSNAVDILIGDIEGDASEAQLYMDLVNGDTYFDNTNVNMSDDLRVEKKLSVGGVTSLNELYLENAPVACSVDNSFMTYFEGNTSTCVSVDADTLDYGNITVSGSINQTITDGNTRYFSNGCYEKVNSTGVYWIC